MTTPEPEYNDHPADPRQLEALIARMNRWLDDLDFQNQLAEQRREARRRKREEAAA